GSVDHAGRFGITLRQDLVELLLAQLIAGRLAERIFARLTHPLAPVLEDCNKGSLTGAIAHKAFSAAQLGVVSVNSKQAQLLPAVREGLCRVGGFVHSVCI